MALNSVSDAFTALNNWPDPVRPLMVSAQELQSYTRTLMRVSTTTGGGRGPPPPPGKIGACTSGPPPPPPFTAPPRPAAEAAKWAAASALAARLSSGCGAGQVGRAHAGTP